MIIMFIFLICVVFILIGGADFFEINEPKMFDPADEPRVCSITIIFPDDILETTEFFHISLTLPFQDAALILSDTSTVFIADTSCKCTIRVLRHWLLTMLSCI